MNEVSVVSTWLARSSSVVGSVSSLRVGPWFGTVVWCLKLSRVEEHG